MKTAQIIIKKGENKAIEIDFEPDLILVFAGSKVIEGQLALADLKTKFPNSFITGCSTSGEIGGINVYDDSLVATAVKFEKTSLAIHEIKLDSPDDSEKGGKELVDKFTKLGLRHIFILSDGLNINGSQLVSGMRKDLPEDIAITGGLAGDGPDFKKTFVIAPSGKVSDKIVVGIGFYGEDLKVGYGSLGGWDTFGLERIVTKSKSNVLYEIDHKPALELYKSFLGDQAKELPSSGLLFPLSMRLSENDSPVVRTILAIDEKEQSLTFAGDIPEGAYVKLMKANVDRLINGAEGAAKVSTDSDHRPELAILISCVGRKLVLKQLVEEEVEAVQEVVGDDVSICGFYSYGEIAPFIQNSKCELHNQTMTITTFAE
tara:strand:+ start:1647 stop:2768 length:1122 start_codon:yes stop_codon:yes gene_type:complete